VLDDVRCHVDRGGMQRGLIEGGDERHERVLHVEGRVVTTAFVIGAAEVA
jgi:hypothetical protein